MENKNNLSLDEFLTENQQFFLDRGVETEDGLVLRLQPGILNNNPHGFLKLEAGLRPYSARWQGTIANAFLIPAKFEAPLTVNEQNRVQNDTQQSVETELLKLKTYLNPEKEILRSIDFLTGKGVSHLEIIKKTGVSKAKLYRLLANSKKQLSQN